MHLTRNEIPVKWRVQKKGTKYVVTTRYCKDKSIPVLVALRDMLKLGQDRREVEKILDMSKIKINGKIIKESRYPVTIFDILNIGDKNYRMIIQNKKFSLEEVSGKEANEKIAKVIGKKVLKKKIIQINLADGRNYQTKEKAKVGDSVIINFKENKISETLPMKDGMKAMFLNGSRIGKVGEIEKINGKEAIIILDKEKINAKLINLMAVK